MVELIMWYFALAQLVIYIMNLHLDMILPLTFDMDFSKVPNFAHFFLYIDSMLEGLFR